jgi:hypothetical protein
MLSGLMFDSETHKPVTSEECKASKSRHIRDSGVPSL